MSRLFMAGFASLALAAPAFAQQPADPHAGHQAPKAAQPKGVQPKAAPAEATPSDAHTGHAMPAPATPADPHAGHAMPAADQPEAVGNAPPPAPPTDHLADRYFDPAAMREARAGLRQEHGGAQASQVMANIAEYQARDGKDGYRWEGEAWFGGDINRFVLKSEGEGARGEGVEEAEVQALYSRAVGPYTDLQAGVRYDFEPNPSRAYATVGFETLAPYWFEVEGALFLSDKGDLSARVEGSYDLRLAQRVVLQPRAELNLAAQDVRATGVGSGVSNAEFGLRLRYEVRREFAPYIGVTYDRSFGRTADFARAAGEDVEATSFVIGLRAWF